VRANRIQGMTLSPLDERIGMRFLRDPLVGRYSVDGCFADYVVSSRAMLFLESSFSTIIKAAVDTLSCPQTKRSGSARPHPRLTRQLAAADYVARIPDALSLEQAAPVLCAGVTTYKGLK
jgi:NADPH:quinone reductase-like Zn-dependent oxidoreductase